MWIPLRWPSSRSAPLPTPSTGPTIIKCLGSWRIRCAPVCGWSFPSARATAAQRGSCWHARTDGLRTPNARRSWRCWTRSRYWMPRRSSWRSGCGSAGSVRSMTLRVPCCRPGCIFLFRIVMPWLRGSTGRRPMLPPGSRSMPGVSWSWSLPPAAAPSSGRSGKRLGPRTPTRPCGS